MQSKAVVFTAPNTVEIQTNQPGTIFKIYARADFGSVVVDVPLENVPESLQEG